MDKLYINLNVLRQFNKPLSKYDLKKVLNCSYSHAWNQVKRLRQLKLISAFESRKAKRNNMRVHSYILNGKGHLILEMFGELHY